MPRAITKVRAIPKPPPIDRPALVDEFGRLQLRLADMRALERRHEQLREIIGGWYAAGAPDASFDEEGKSFSLHIGPKARKRTVTDLAKLYKEVGVQKFLGLVTVQLEKLDRVIPPAEQTGLVSSDRTGSRSIQAIAKYRETAA